MKYCPDCGNAQTNHTSAWTSSLLTQAFLPVGRSTAGIRRAFEAIFADPFYNSLMPLLMKALVALRLADLLDAPDAKTTGRARVLWEEAKRRGILVREFRLLGNRSEAFLAEYRGRQKTFIGLPRPGSAESPGFAWMDDKEVMRERFSAVGIPTARGGVATSLAQAYALFDTLRPPVITKPKTGSRSRHTTTHISTKEELALAFKKAAALSPWVIVQEEAEGFVYRGTLVGGKLVAALRREPPFVEGDGAQTVAELITEENKNPKRDEHVFHKMELTADSYAELARQGLILESVPEEGRVVTLSQKSSRGVGGGTTDVTDIVHPDNREILEKAAAVLEDPLVGIDLIIGDISRSWREQERSSIIECNSVPFIDLHYAPLRGTSRDIAGPLWDIVFPSPAGNK
jgi:D-alanine-D-alanine ligase-like ATP-grasp enzyme